MTGLARSEELHSDGRSSCWACGVGRALLCAEGGEGQEDEEAFLERVVTEGGGRAGYLGKLKLRRQGTLEWWEACNVVPCSQPVGGPSVLVAGTRKFYTVSSAGVNE